MARGAIYICTALSFAFPLSAPAQGLTSAYSQIEDFLTGAQNKTAKINIELHAFSNELGLADKRVLSLHNQGQMDLRDSVQNLIYQKNLHPMIRVESSKGRNLFMHRQLNLTEAAKEEILEFSFHVGSTPICQHQVRAMTLRGQKTPFVLGSVPTITDVAGLNQPWPTASLARENIVQHLSVNGAFVGDLELVEAKKCLFVPVLRERLLCVCHEPQIY